MSSTYSPSLRIELIGAGEQAGTWNTTTNTNLGTLIETAIAGNSSITIISTAQALIALDGATDQARQAILTLTGGSAAFSLYAPPVNKQYIVHNTTAYDCSLCNGSAANVTTPASGNVPLVIGAGKKLTVFTNGTSFSTTDASGLTGVLGVANGGTGVTTSTGTGSTVLSTAPTLVNPTVVTEVVQGSETVTGSLINTGSAYLNGAPISTVAQSTAIDTATERITLASAAYSQDVAVLVSSSDTLPTGLSANTTYYVVQPSATTFFSGVGSISGTTLTIASVYTGAIGIGTVIAGIGVTSTTVTGLIGGTGGVGTYTIGTSQTASSTIISGAYSGSQTIKLSTSIGGSPVNITAVGTGNLTLTPVSFGITAPAGTTTTALATCAFVSASNPFSSANWTASETVTTQTATISIASPAVVSVTTAPANGTAVAFSTTGALPTGITANTAYYVINSSGTTYQLSLTAGGTAINTSGTQSGVHTETTSKLVFKYKTLSKMSIDLGGNLITAGNVTAYGTV